MKKHKPNVLEFLKKEVLQYIGTRSGMTKKSIHLKFGVENPNEEDNRKRVWQIAAALSGLIFERCIDYTTVNGVTFYRPVVAV